LRSKEDDVNSRLATITLNEKVNINYNVILITYIFVRSHKRHILMSISSDAGMWFYENEPGSQREGVICM